MKKKHEHIIESVRPGSIAEELGIEPVSYTHLTLPTT